MTALFPELIHQLTHGAVLEAELFRHLLLRTARHENGAQRFVASMIQLGGLREKLAATGVVHDRCSLEMSVGFTVQTKTNRKAKTAASRRKSSTNRPKMQNSCFRDENLNQRFAFCRPENQLTLAAKNAGKTRTGELKISVDFRVAEIGV
jgi:hypothetical protein